MFYNTPIKSTEKQSIPISLLLTSLIKTIAPDDYVKNLLGSFLISQGATEFFNKIDEKIAIYDYRAEFLLESKKEYFQRIHDQQKLLKQEEFYNKTISLLESQEQSRNPDNFCKYNSNIL